MTQLMFDLFEPETRPVITYPLLDCGVHDWSPKGQMDHAQDCLDFVCPICGEQAFNGFGFNLNHGLRSCASRILTVNHAFAAYMWLTGDRESAWTNCAIRSHRHVAEFQRAGWPESCVIDYLRINRERALRMGVDVVDLPPMFEGKA